MNNVYNEAENQFIHGYEDASRMKGSRSISANAIINKLQQKNFILQKQVNKIDRVISSMSIQEKPRYTSLLPEIKPDAVKKQLQNAYKQIKLYQYEIQKRRNMIGSQSAYVQEINKTEKVYKQKVQIHERLKRQLLTLKNQSKQLTKMLKNNGKKKQYETKQSNLSKDIKYLQQLVRQGDQKRALHISNLQKQKLSILQRQKEILKENSHEFLQSIKFKIFKPQSDRSQILSPSRSIFDIEKDIENQDSRVSKIQSAAQQNVEIISPETYQSLQNDIRLLKKMQTDYEAKIAFITKERDESSEKNFRSRNKLLEIQFEVQSLEKNISELKKLIDPAMFKPKPMPQNEKKKSPSKKKGPSIPHSYKFIEIGQITKTGKRFSDRTLIGKVNSKIIGLTLYKKVSGSQFVGIQATYLIIGDKAIKKKGNLNLLADPKKQQLDSQVFELGDGDFIKTIDIFNKKGKIVGISMVSSKNKIAKIGDFSGQINNLTMRQSEYPMCFFGSMLKDGFENIGVQVYEDKINENKQHINK